jgi:phosphohistidine swiveling domain-containing protein
MFLKRICLQIFVKNYKQKFTKIIAKTTQPSCLTEHAALVGMTLWLVGFDEAMLAWLRCMVEGGFIVAGLK